MRIVLSILALSAITLAIGCGPGNTLSREDAVKAYGVVGMSGPAPSYGSTSGIATVTYSSSYEGSFPCPEGGTIDVSMNASQTDQSSATVSADATYNSCEINDIIVDGNLSIDYDVSSSSDNTSVTATMTMTGALFFSGEIEGSCILDFVVSTSLLGSSAQVSLSGTFCGYDVEELQAEYAATYGFGSADDQ